MGINSWSSRVDRERSPSPELPCQLKDDASQRRRKVMIYDKCETGGLESHLSLPLALRYGLFMPGGGPRALFFLPKVL